MDLLREGCCYAFRGPLQALVLLLLWPPFRCLKYGFKVYSSTVSIFDRAEGEEQGTGYEEDRFGSERIPELGRSR